jgi:hypothetical protein
VKGAKVEIDRIKLTDGVVINAPKLKLRSKNEL